MPSKLSLASFGGRSSSSSVDSATGELRNTRRSSFERVLPEQKRLSNSGKASGNKPVTKKGQAQALAQALKMDMEIESPPVVFYGDTQTSSGAILSGRLKLHVTEQIIRIEKFTMVLQAKVTSHKPVSAHCADCAAKRTELNKWTFLAEPVSLRTGIHDYPFSHLLPGHLPATTHAHLANIEYFLVATVTTSTGEDITYERLLNIKRSLKPGNERTSIRIFPPTNLTANVILPPLIHPIGDFTIQFRLDGVLQREKQTRWKLRKVNWRLDEHSRIVSPACARHSAKLGGQGKGVVHEHVLTVGCDELKSGWKSNFSDTDGKIDMEFQASIRPSAEASCDVESPSGFSITHNLVIELIVVEEHCPNKSTRLVTPTGAARVLRMQFKTVLTERSGLGISWDEEQPPMYGDVPESPPTYTQVEDYDLGHDDMETLQLD